jgi:hypothetical protein
VTGTIPLIDELRRQLCTTMLPRPSKVAIAQSRSALVSNGTKFQDSSPYRFRSAISYVGPISKTRREIHLNPI